MFEDQIVDKENKVIGPKRIESNKSQTKLINQVDEANPRYDEDYNSLPPDNIDFNKIKNYVVFYNHKFNNKSNEHSKPKKDEVLTQVIRKVYLEDAKIKAFIFDSFWFVLLLFFKEIHNYWTDLSFLFDRMASSWNEVVVKYTFDFENESCYVDGKKWGLRQFIESLLHQYSFKDNANKSQGKTNKDGERTESKVNIPASTIGMIIRKIFDEFWEVLSQTLFVMLYYSYPKSRKQFNYKFRNQLASLFSLSLCGFKQAKSSTNHWNLDIGSGNLLENVENIVESEKEFDRRLLTSEYIKVVIDSLVEQKIDKNTGERPAPNKSKFSKILDENQMILFKDKDYSTFKYSPLIQRYFFLQNYKEGSKGLSFKTKITQPSKRQFLREEKLKFHYNTLIKKKQENDIKFEELRKQELEIEQQIRKRNKEFKQEQEKFKMDKKDIYKNLSHWTNMLMKKYMDKMDEVEKDN
eukprot:Mrub_02717.p1 GENE.Mrub_02717~~Mrub_02717.p1  ORF type:complete len:513 (-),score=122.54 Mrub_02717:95-1492(-)